MSPEIQEYFMPDKHAKFARMLDEHHQWPCPYVFKFIVPTENLPLLIDLFEGETLTTRESKSGKYTSVTMESTMCSGESVMKTYHKAAQVPGLMSL
jgi:putative lipoic acid-binding regulatory protein